MHADALIFDMDGLLIDSEPLWWRVEIALAAQHGKVWNEEQAQQCIGTGLPNAVATIARELNIDIDVDQGVRWLVDAFIERADELQLKPGARELIDAASAAGLPLALASSSTKRLIEAVMNRFGDIAARFQHKISGEHVTDAKPAPDIFLLTAERLGVAPAGCVVLEDSIAGVQAGITAGMQVIAVPEHAPERFASLTPHVVDDLHHARTLLGL